jgi:succinoglycan biosynthesis protein ExoW
MSDRVSVIIPFFQKRSGILSRAVRSALEQTDVDDVRVTVVDNLSPVPAARELEGLVSGHPDRVRVLSGPRPGPGAARNTGLDAAGADSTYVAFLDSDDEWAHNHLRNAVRALGEGYDFYFSDYFQLGQSISAFRRTAALELGRHRRLSGGPFYEFRGDMFTQVLTANLIGTSTVVYRRDAFPGIRFEEDYSHAGEDYLFWLEVANRTQRIVFSTETECRYGEGVNIYSGSRWGSEGSLPRTYCELKYRRAVADRYHLGPAVARHNRRQVRRLRKYFVAEVLHRLARRAPIQWTTVARQLAVDPLTGILFLPLAVSVAVTALRARAGSSAPGRSLDTRH